MVIDDSDSDVDDNDVLIGCLRGDIVGLQYYRGTVFPTMSHIMIVDIRGMVFPTNGISHNVSHYDR